MADDEDDDEFDFLSGTMKCATKLDLGRGPTSIWGTRRVLVTFLSEVLDEGMFSRSRMLREMMGT